jgi:hypothetical protein
MRISKHVDLLTADDTVKAIPAGQNLPGLISGRSRLVFVVEEFLKYLFSYHEEPLHMHTLNGQTAKRQMVAQGLYSSNVKCWAKFSKIFRRIFETFFSSSFPWNPYSAEP